VKTGGSRQEEVVGYMNHVLTSLGAITVGGVGVAIGRDPSALIPAEEKAFELGKRLAQSVRANTGTLTKKNSPDRRIFLLPEYQMNGPTSTTGMSGWGGSRNEVVNIFCI
jgi:hypothetical protein